MQNRVARSDKVGESEISDRKGAVCAREGVVGVGQGGEGRCGGICGPRPGDGVSQLARCPAPSASATAPVHPDHAQP